MTGIQRVCGLLAIHPRLGSLTLSQLLTALQLCCCLKRDISLPQPISKSNYDHAPAFLPPTIQEFLSEVLELDIEDVDSLWGIIKDDVWELPTEEETYKLREKYFQKYGWKRELSAYYTSAALISGF